MTFPPFRSFCFSWALLAIVGFTTSSTACAEEWGTLTGQFIWPDEPPEREKLVPERDAAFCGKHDLREERLIVDDETGGLANVVLWFVSKDMPIHPDLQAIGDPAVLDNKNCRFEPHILLMRAGQKITVKNSDPVAHATQIFLLRNTPISVTTPQLSSENREFSKSEPLPAVVSCPIHPWMKSYVLISDTPYMTKTDAEGKFTIPNLPAGEWTVKIWHEAGGYLDAIRFNRKKHELTKGQLTLTIKPGTLDLGEIEVNPDEFE